MQAPQYEPTTSFYDAELNNQGGRSTVGTALLDGELEAIADSVNALQANQELNQRDDGEIRDQRVKLHTLAADVLALLTSRDCNPRGAWVTATAYAPKDLVSYTDTNTYVCVSAHTSGVFATDLAAGRWLLFTLGTAIGAGAVAFAPTGTIASTNVQDAINESDTEIRALLAAETATRASADTAITTDLASTAVGDGAALVGSNDAGSYFNGATVEEILQELADPEGEFHRGEESVFKYIPEAEWPAIRAYTSTTDLASYLQAALTDAQNLYFPNGRYNTSAKLIPRIDSKIRGESRRGVQLRATAAVAILEYPINNVDCILENIYFCASLAGASGVTCANTAGSNHDYLIRLHVRECDFGWELAYGINADLIYATIDVSTFGYYGTFGAQPAPGASTMVAIRSFAVTGNAPNLNRVNDCNINAGSLTVPAVDISGGVGWQFHNVDWSYGGFALRTADITILRFTGTNWLEGNVATNSIVQIGACSTPVDMGGINWASNSATRHIEYASSVVAGLRIYDNVFGLPVGSGFPIYDTTTVTTLLPANGSVAWFNNYVSGGDALNKMVTGTDFRGGRTSPRIVATVSTSGGAATLLSCSDPGASVAYNGVGDFTLTSSQPLGSATNNIAAVCTARTANAIRVVGVTTTTIRAQGFTDAGAATDGIVGVVAYGA